MPILQNANDNLAVLNQVENDRTIKTLTDLYQAQRLLKEEMQQIASKKYAAHQEELWQNTKPEWDEVNRKIDEIKYTVHRAYEASWSRLLDLYVRLHEALVKTGPLVTRPFFDGIASLAFQGVVASSGVVGGLVGGVGHLFGVGDGVSATARRASKLVSGEQDNDVQYHVNMNDDGEVQCWLHHSDGRVPSQEEQDGFKAEIRAWLHQHGYVPGNEPATFEPAPDSGALKLTTERFAQLRDGGRLSLAQYFARIKENLQLEPEFNQVAEEDCHRLTMAM